ncbi:protein FAM177B-like [Artemia franciscana]|uniref:Uncharacterized protein n=1 Tax=Artemia franciscana TaxID=6661 RepID=A0AA88IFA2_ARTSF|nr:hypothetical protein QYM36_007790 [Artemia franciscana]KAK2727055.1 hypothetical protein QYM36_007790 [Artemia franciscana]
MIQGTQEENVNTEYSKRKKILHFSDGTLEVDEDEIDMDSVIVEEAVNSFQENINIHALPWSDWILHMVSQAGSKTLAACDYAGGALADFFGITSPKYYLEMEAAKEMMKEEEDMTSELRSVNAEMASWQANPMTDPNTVISHQSNISQKSDVSVSMYKFSESVTSTDNPPHDGPASKNILSY